MAGAQSRLLAVVEGEAQMDDDRGRRVELRQRMVGAPSKLLAAVGRRGAGCSGVGG